MERVLRLLESFGFSRVDAEIYVYLAKTGPQKGKDLTKRLKIPKQQLYPALKRLERRGVVTSKSQNMKLFSALTFDKLLNLYLELSIEKTKTINDAKIDIIKSWRDIVEQKKGQQFA